MKDLFFIIKGQYRKGVEPSYVNSVNKDTYYIGGYDPFNPETPEWYMAVDNITFTTISCGGDLKKVLQSVYKVIKKYKGDTKKYLKGVKDSDTKESPIMQEMRRRVYEEFGDYYRDEVKVMADLAYSELKEEKPVFRSKKLMAKAKPNTTVEVETPKKTEVIETPTLKKVRPKVCLGVKKIK